MSVGRSILVPVLVALLFVGGAEAGWWTSADPVELSGPETIEYALPFPTGASILPETYATYYGVTPEMILNKPTSFSSLRKLLQNGLTAEICEVTEIENQITTIIQICVEYVVMGPVEKLIPTLQRAHYLLMFPQHRTQDT